jgi:hypothetical protein
MKFQRIIDATLRAGQSLPSPQVPADVLAERERGFSERAKEIEMLRQTGPGAVAETVPISIVFEVVRHRGHWRTFHGNKHSSGFPDQGSAVAAAKKLAIAKRKQGYDVKVILRRTDGNEVTQTIDD